MRHGRIVAKGPTIEVLTPENVQRVYDVEADVQIHEDTGHLTVVLAYPPKGRHHLTKERPPKGGHHL